MMCVCNGAFVRRRGCIILYNIVLYNIVLYCIVLYVRMGMGERMRMRTGERMRMGMTHIVGASHKRLSRKRTATGARMIRALRAREPNG